MWDSARGNDRPRRSVLSSVPQEKLQWTQRSALAITVDSFLHDLQISVREMALVAVAMPIISAAKDHYLCFALTPSQNHRSTAAFVFGDPPGF